MPFLPVLIKLKSRENNYLIFIVSHVNIRFFLFCFLSYFSLLARSQTCFETIVRVMLIMLRKNTRNNILIGGMRVCERDQRLNESILSVSAVTRK